MNHKNQEAVLMISATIPKKLAAEVEAWASREHRSLDELLAEALKRYLKEERRKAFLATNPIYE